MFIGAKGNCIHFFVHRELNKCPVRHGHNCWVRRFMVYWFLEWKSKVANACRLNSPSLSYYTEEQVGGGDGLS